MTTASQRLVAAARKAIALISDDAAEERGLIRNALIGLQTQHAVAVKTFGERDPHIAELAAEERALRDRARELGAAWA